MKREGGHGGTRRDKEGTGSSSLGRDAQQLSALQLHEKQEEKVMGSQSAQRAIHPPEFTQSPAGSAMDNPPRGDAKT